LRAQADRPVTRLPYNLTYYVGARRTILNTTNADDPDRFHNILKSSEICLRIDPYIFN
jgi:hypothetical protein